MACVVYWIHHPEHTDMFNQGYIGISNNVKKRLYDHKNTTENLHLKRAIAKYGWGNLVKTTILIAETAYCLMIEAKLRAEEKIGWNIAKGGGMPPLTKWNLGKKLSDEVKDKISSTKTGHRHTPEVEAIIVKHLIENGKSTRFKKGEVQAINKIEHICPHCEKIGKGIAMKRWHLDNCKYKGNKNGIN